MQPSRRPGGDSNNPRSHWVNPGYNKYSPGIAPTPDPSRITRIYPTPPLLVERRQRDVAAGTNANDANSGTDGDLVGGAVIASISSATTATAATVTSAVVKGPEEEGGGVDDEERCPICRDQLPNVYRGIIKCGHVFCFVCIHRWVKKQQSNCPACRAEVRQIKKTLSMPEIEEKNRNWKPPTKPQMKRAKRKSAIGKPPVRPYVIADTIRVRHKRSNEQARQNRMEPHPQAPGGFMHEEEAVPVSLVSAAAEPVVPPAADLSNIGVRPQQVEDVDLQQVAVVNPPPTTSAAASVPLPTQPQQPQPPQPSATEPEELRLAIEAGLEEATTSRVQPSAGGEGGGGESSPNVDSGHNGHDGSRSEAAAIQRSDSDHPVAAPPAPPATTTPNGSDGDGGRNGRNTTSEAAAAAGGVAGGVAAVVIAATAVASPFAPVPPPPPSTAPSNSSTSNGDDHNGSDNPAIEEESALSAQVAMGNSRAAARDVH